MRTIARALVLRDNTAWGISTWLSVSHADDARFSTFYISRAALLFSREVGKWPRYCNSGFAETVVDYPLPQIILLVARLLILCCCCTADPVPVTTLLPSSTPSSSWRGHEGLTL